MFPTQLLAASSASRRSRYLGCAVVIVSLLPSAGHVVAQIVTSGGAGGAAAPEWELRLTKFAPPAAPIELPSGRTHSLESANDKRIRAALEKPDDFNFIDALLGDVATSISLKYKIDVLLDVEALAADGKGSETIVTAKLKGVSLHDALTHILRSQELTYLVKHDVLLITTRAAASQPENLTTRLYEVQDLVVPPNDEAIHAPQFDELIEAIQSLRASDWQNNGGAIGMVRPFEGPGILALMVRHDDDGHREVEQLLDILRKSKNPELLKSQASQPLVIRRAQLKGTAARAQTAAKNNAAAAKTEEPAKAEPTLPAPTVTSFPQPTAAELKIRAALEKPGETQYLCSQLGDVAKDFAQRLDIQVLLDHEELAADGKGIETPITKQIRNSTNGNILRLILDGQGLDYRIHNSALVITTKAAIALPERHTTRVYPVHDLVVTPSDAPPANPDFDALIDVLTSMVRTMDDWSDNGGTISTMWQYSGPGSLSIVVRGPDYYHNEVEQVLKLLRSARVPEVLNLQQKRPTVRPTSVEVLPPGAFQGGGFF